MDDYYAGYPCKCKKKIMAVRDQLNPTWKYYFNQWAHSDVGKQSDCSNARDAVMNNEFVITNMVTVTTKSNECSINGTFINGTLSTLKFVPAREFISVEQTQQMIDYAYGCNF